MRIQFPALLLILLAGGCSLAGALGPKAADTATGATPDTLAIAQAGDDYNAFRRQLIQQGWLPLENPRCGDGFAPEQACRRWLELQTCSADGRCVMAWGDSTGRQVARIIVRGLPREDAEVSRQPRIDATPSLSIVGQDHTAIACPAADFERFLVAYASDDATRRAYSAALVRARVLVSDGDGDRIASVYVPGSEPTVFDVTHRDGAFHHVGVDGVDPAPLGLTVSATGDSAREVSYRYGSSEGRTFAFRWRQGCWYLTGNPQSTGP